MANLLASGASWSPSGIFDGTKFVFISTGEIDTITYSGPIANGDVLAFNIALVAVENGDPLIRILQGGSEIAAIGGGGFSPPLPASYTSPPLTADGGEVSLVVEPNFGFYGHELTLTPIIEYVPCVRVVDIRYSKDGGRNWSNWKQRSLGEVGEFVKRVRALRLGTGRQWVFETRVTSNCRADLIAASIQIEGE